MITDFGGKYQKMLYWNSRYFK